jgi:hypothetical protein
MLMFRGPNAEQTLSANSYAMLTSIVLGAGLKDGTVTDDDRKMYVDAWSQPGALTGGLNYYRASGVGPRQSAPPDGDARIPTSRVGVAGWFVRIGSPR